MLRALNTIFIESRNFYKATIKDAKLRTLFLFVINQLGRKLILFAGMNAITH